MVGGRIWTLVGHKFLRFTFKIMNDRLTTFHTRLKAHFLGPFQKLLSCIIFLALSLS